MNYSKLQKFLSGLIIFSLLFGISFKIPIMDFSAYAWNSDYYDLVSIVVEEEIYDSIKSEVKRYAEDIQWVLENTKVVILPTPKNASPFKVASLLELLYNEWYKWLTNVNYESKLVWTILVGDIAIPEVYLQSNSSKTIVPYTDFEDKQYIYNHENWKFEENEDNINWIKSEIWHWVISPNIWTSSENVSAIKNFFNKNHDYYTWSWNFKTKDLIMNWKNSDSVSADYVPSVFYYDSFRESSSLNYNKYVWYQAYLDNKEDIVYNRFGKVLADKIKGAVMWDQENTVQELAWKVDPSFDISSFTSAMDLSTIPDIQTRSVVENVSKKLIQMFSDWTIGDFRKDVHNAWRYNGSGTSINMDMVPYIITLLDWVNDKVLKQWITDLEDKIDNVVKTKLQKDLYLPYRINEYFNSSPCIYWTGTVIDCNYVPLSHKDYFDRYDNLLYWKQIKDITKAEDCSIFRWSTYGTWNLVAANRWYDYTKIQWDVTKLQAESTSCLEWITTWSSLKWYWWWNTPLNVDYTKYPSLLKSSDITTALEPIFDIAWSLKVTGKNLIYPKVPELKDWISYKDCLKNNFLLSIDQEMEEWSTQPEIVYQIPINWQSMVDWSCHSVSKKTVSNIKTYEELSAQGRLEYVFSPPKLVKLNWWICIEDGNTTNNEFSNYLVDVPQCSGIYHDFVDVKACNWKTWNWECPIPTGTMCSAWGGNVNKTECSEDPPILKKLSKCSWLTCIDGNLEITYKKIPSYVIHKSPTFSEIDAEIKNMVTPSLPIDKNRYIDFKWSSWYQKINYPYLFRLKLLNGDDLSFENIKKALKKYLTNYNSVLGEDLFSFLQSHSDIDWWEEWKSNYLDSLVFSLYWDKLNISWKYKFVFENYLSDQFWWNDFKFSLPKNKSQYEISYLWAPWNSSSMYIMLDPENKKTNPYADIYSKNASLDTSLLWSNIAGKEDEAGNREFKCAPPEWVIIREWLPAISCRLKNMLPPKISFSSDKCAWNIWLSDEDLQELLENGWDLNKNWVVDCIEENLSNWTIELSSNASKYNINKLWKLKATIKGSDWNTVTLDSSTNITFKLTKVSAPRDESKSFTQSNSKEVYNIDTPGWKYSDYIDFVEWDVRTKFWVWEKSFNLKNKIADITFKTIVEVKDYNWKIILTKESNPITIKVRDDSLFVDTYKLYDSGLNIALDYWVETSVVSSFDNIFITNSDTIENQKNNLWSLNSVSSAKEKLFLVVSSFEKSWVKKNVDYPLSVKVLDDNNKVVLEKNITNNVENSVSPLWSFQRAWIYNISIVDANGFEIKKEVTLLPSTPSELGITLWSSVMETWNSITTNIVTIFDEFDNVVSGNMYNIDLKIDWNWILFNSNVENELNLNKLHLTTYEWYKTFDLVSTDEKSINTINFSIKNASWDEILKKSVQVKTVAKVYLFIQPLQTKINVWWDKYAYQISYRDDTWSVIWDFNSRVYFNIPKVYWVPTRDYFDIKKWKWVVEFVSTKVAWENIQVEFQAEWLKSIWFKNITILPEKPVQMELYVSDPKLEATPSSYSSVKVELKDRYWNLVFTDNSTKANIELLNDYKDVISLKTKSYKFIKWVASFKINATNIPWIAYFKVWSSPSLYDNSFNITDNSWSLTINWVWEVAWKLETYYFWNKDKIIWKKYNSIYTTLLWSNYWDVTQKDYLAWSLLFEEDNRALWVTSLLNNPYSTNDVINILKNWNVKNIYKPSDLSQDIKTNVNFKDDNIILDIYNNSLNIFLWNVYYNFDDNTEIKVCESDLNNCVKNYDKTTIFVKLASSNYSTKLIDNKIVIKDKSDLNLMDIDNLGNIKRYSNISFEKDENNTNDYLLLKILKDWEFIWNIGYNLVDSKFSISRDENLFNTKINTVWNSILVLLKSSTYGSKDSMGNKIIYYNDPFDSSAGLDSFSSMNADWYENFTEKWWLWWSDWNKTLLAFASWKSIWESVKDYMSFSVINLWDPVVSLKKIKEKLPKTKTDRNFDSTIWKLISTDNDIESYKIFDYNNDSREDILLIKNNWKLTLLENKQVESNFINKWNLANAVDLWDKKLVLTWDFTWDWYDDIFFVNNKWKPFLLNNYLKDFSRISLIEQFDLVWNIIISKKFDMNNDGKDDVVTLDDNWSINIFYWWWTSKKPKFTKNKIGDDFWVNISADIRNDNGLVYFDWLYQLWKTWALSEEIPWENWIPYEMTDSLIFENLFYKINQDAQPTEYSVDNLDNIWPYNEGNLADSTNNLSDDYTTFIKSNYSENLWLKVEKKFTDINWWFLQSWDIVSVDVDLTNTSGNILKWIVYWEKIEDVFTLDENSIKIDDKNINLSFDITDVNFLIDKFSLNSWEKVKLSYKMKTKPIKYGNIIVWLYEKGEVWDDKYWDIILKEDNQNCSNPVEIYRSISAKGYQKWIKEPICNEDKIKLPDVLEKNKIDLDWNWIPDYIDELSDPANQSKMKEYSEENMDSVKDSSKYNDNKELWANIEDSVEEAETIVNWLSCWFWWWCIATPMNWAPLAPGWDPTLFWKPIWDGFKVKEWLPIFSALTFIWYWPICWPAVWPISPLTTWCSGLWAWWYLWVDNAANFFRLFITPTLTWAVWTAICFGWPASVMWIANPKWMSPIVPGWNCIVMAKPLSSCSADGSDWDIASTWFSGLNWQWFDLINWNCKAATEQPNFLLEKELFLDYYDYKKTWIPWANLESDLNNHYKTTQTSNNNSGNLPDKPLFSLNWWSWKKIDVWIDFSSLWGWNFEDVIKIKKSRIWTFPNFLMDWVTRQIEEIANKLTDFPTIYIILPNFDWIFDWKWSELSWSKNEDTNTDNIKVSDKIVKKLPDGTESKIASAESWIKEAYGFLSQIPLVKIEKETVNLNIPWVDKESIDRTLASRKSTVDQRNAEFKRAKEAWSFWAACNWPDKAKCEESNSIKNNISVNFQSTLNSIERNIEIIDEYKKTPEKIYNWLNAKEKYLKQIICNIDIISSLMWWRISDNWKRFKAWVETYILIKAMLKSWQMLIDLFVDYDAECHQCKNERSDLQTTIWWLISMVIPSIPVIQFPKWPDIIVDLHNIRAWLTINLPEFSVASRPIVLPYLPDLHLPDTPTVNINFPKLPLLPSIEIPELPDIPSLPSVELPDLPPPPTLPKILSSIEAVLNILKLIAKMMCIMKSSPFVPEWRAWDHIAFITERQWFLSFDFLMPSLPQFSFPFVDAINITSYVNLEFETDFIVELAKQAAMPINSFANNLIPLLDVNIDSVGVDSNNVNIDVWADWNVNWEVWMNNNKKLGWLFALVIAKNIKNLFGFIDNHKNELIDNTEFKKLVNKSLASENVVWDPRMDKIRKLWDDVNNMTYSKEDKIISDLKKSNKDKFDLVKDILNTEIIKNKETQKKYKNYNNNEIIKVAYNDEKIDLDFYNKQFNNSNNNFIKSLNDLVDNPGNDYKADLKKDSKNLINKLKWWLVSYQNSSNKNLLSNATSQTTPAPSGNACQQQSKSEYKFTYEWIYIVESGISYRLFDYIDNLSWDEETTIIDFDKDSDQDLIYMVDGEIYLKENFKKEPSKSYVSTPPAVLDSNDNKFYNWDIFYEAVNNFNDTWSDNESINVKFSSIKWKENLNYRIEFYEIVDKSLNLLNINYTPKLIKKSIIDSFVWIDDLIMWGDEKYYYETRNNVWYIASVWNLRDIELITPELINIKRDLMMWSIASLSVWTTLYSWNSGFTLFFREKWSEVEHKLNIWSHANIKLKKWIEVVWITWDAYLKWSKNVTLIWTDILQYKWLPLFAWSKIKNNSLSSSWEHPYIDINYYEGSVLELDFTKISNYEIYDLWSVSDDYLVRTDRKNDYYYAKIKPFYNNIEWTYSNQILFSPQVESDTNPPELFLDLLKNNGIPSDSSKRTGTSSDSLIKIPIFQKKKIDLSESIYEKWGVKNIKEMSVDFDLEIDSNWDWNPKNDKDTDKISITKNSSKLEIEFWGYDKLFKKNIWITLIDNNWNVGFTEVSFEVYSPTPEINSYTGWLIIWNLDEDLNWEPVSLFRYRSWIIQKLKDINGGNNVSSIGWNYEFATVSNWWEWLNLLQSGNLIAFIKEKTWVIELKDFIATIDVLPSNNIKNDVVYPKIIINKDWDNIFYEYIKIVWKQNINVVENFESVKDKWIYLKLLDKTSYTYFQNPGGANYSPWVLSIYRISDTNKESTFTVFPDWRINTLNDYYSLKYFNYNWNIWFTLYDKHFNKEVAQILLVTEWDYILK